MSEMEKFKHKFFGWMEADARRWVNADGSSGGIVATSAQIHLSAKVALTGEVGPYASIGLRASIGDGASVGKDDWWITVGPQGSRRAMLTAVASKYLGLRWYVGCECKITSDQFRDRIAKTHGKGHHADDYLATIAYVESHPGFARWQSYTQEDNNDRNHVEP